MTSVRGDRGALFETADGGVALPDALTGVLAIVEGTRRGSPSGLARDVQAWLASPEEGLRAAIESAQGAAAASQALERLAPSILTVLGTAASARACWAEVTRRPGGENETSLARRPDNENETSFARRGGGEDETSAGGREETCLAGASVDATGQISRLVWLRAPLVPGGNLGTEGTVPDARPILQGYFADLMGSRFRDAAGHFTADAIYSHPPYVGGTERVLFQGRDTLWRGFAEQRGPSPARQIITHLSQHGSRVFVEGVVEGISNGGSFFSTAQITRHGEIARYVAFYVAQRVAV